MPYISIHGGKLYYEEHGGASLPPILLLHGNGEDMHIFDELLRMLSGSFHFILLDSRSHGLSVHENPALSYDIMAGDTKRLINALNLRDLTVVGFSDGAIIATLLLTDSEVSIKNAVLIGLNTNPSGLTDEAMKEMLIERDECAESGNERELALLNMMINEPNISLERLKCIKSNVLLVVGSDDMIKPEHTREIACAIPNSRLWVIEGADHMIPQSNPLQLKNIIIGFLRSCMEE